MRTQPRRLGLLGGITWHSSLEFERLLNEGVNARLGGSSAADLLVRSYDFQQIADAQAAGDWDRMGAMFAADAAALERAGAEAIMICANTMHKVAPAVSAAIGIPLIHMLDATADAILAAGLDTVALLGTGYTMRDPFYRDHMAARGITTIVPQEEELAELHDLIYDSLARGVVPAHAPAWVRGVYDHLRERGAQGVISGCTEIPMVLTAQDVEDPYFDSMGLHVDAALDFALRD
ncbi:aspartate/glutamate racemase family protein [Demequina activiva]|uniref:Aspartate racemase n=1 Tax=Demequina activiva TaxID=1582364 RepID=A0A919UKR5_9MICO|nr:aspartate/glutamate racemase family protein [Demequina activiva]GIG53968.1 aspartate racemase [Demequina activiva]